jgi:Excalibur calcium-binding domain
MYQARRPRHVSAAVTVLVTLVGLAACLSAHVQAAPASPAGSFAYISASRQGSAVYVNALVKQSSSTGVVRSPNRTVYLQRDLNGNMLSRVTNSQGIFTVGFISVPNYRYRFIVAATASALGTTSGVAQTTSPPVSYLNCAALNTVYPHGVGQAGAHDHTASSSNPVLDFIVSSAVYSMNTGRDADHDGIAGERH